MQRMSREALLGYLMLAPAVIWVVLFLIVPLVVVLVISFYTPVGAAGFVPVLTFDNYIRIFFSPTYVGILLLTLRLSLTVVAACVVLAYPAAYFLAMKIRDEARKTILLVAMLIPFWIDWTVRMLAWWPILGRLGVINAALLYIGVLKEPSDLFIFNEMSATFVLIQSYVLFMIAPIFLSMIKMDPSMLEAAETLRANKLQSFYHITFKMSLPGVIIGCVFVFVMTMADFATPRLLGGFIQTIGLSIAYQMGVLNWPLATAFATVLMTVTVLVVYGMFRVVDIKRMLF